MATNQPIEEWISEAELEKLITKKYFNKIQLERIAMSPTAGVSKIDIYQVWMFQKK